MSAPDFTPIAYLKEGCPYSFKFLLFMAEAGLLDRIRIVRCDPESGGFAAVKDKLEAATAEPATFPTVEVDAGRYLSESDRLIEHFARANDVSPQGLPALSFYKETIFPQLHELHDKAK